MSEKPKFDFPVGPGKGTLSFSGRLDPADAGHLIIGAAQVSESPVYVRIKRGWRQRLFSWPWRPWTKWEGPVVSMQVLSSEISEGPDGPEVTVTMEQIEKAKD